MGFKKHTPWFIEFTAADYDDTLPIIGRQLKNPEHKAIYAFHDVKKICEKHDIWYIQQCINITKKDKPNFYRLYFKTEEDMITIKIVR